VIPYLLLKSAAGGYFTYQRLPQGGEQRLFGMHSIGVGGHINDDRCHPGLAFESPVLRPKWVAEGLQRELAEELVLPPTGAHGLGRLRLHGFLALNETPVDRVHVGVVVVVELAPGREHECRVNEDDRLRPVGWLTSAELARQARDVTFEGWSRALIAAGLP
jgi:predicted NUDIX family phosphoesterase